MTTPRIHTLVSLAALALAFTTGCAGAPARGAADATAAASALPLAIRFDNGARDFVHVYLVGQQREWLLGRVEPGARASLRIPVAAMAESEGTMRLAVLTGQRATLRAAAEPRAVLTPVPQMASDILSQQWSFAQPGARGQLTSLRVWP